MTLATICHGVLRGFSPYEVVQDVIQSPEKYHLIELGLYMDKEMEWGVCIITPKLSEMKNAWFFFNQEEDYPASYNDQWDNGEKISIPGFFLLIKDEKSEKYDIETHLRSLHLKLEFSTEAAGQMDWSGGRDGWWGYTGKRFTKEIDMAAIKPADEDMLERYPWVSIPVYY